MPNTWWLLRVLHGFEKLRAMFGLEVFIDRTHPCPEGIDISLIDFHAFGLKLLQSSRTDLGRQGDLIVLKSCTFLDQLLLLFFSQATPGAHADRHDAGRAKVLGH